MRAHRQRELSAYRPLDEILASPSVRLLRALRWWDWVSAGDLLEACEAPEYLPERQRHHNALYWLVGRGAIERRLGLYRITPAGRLELGQRIARAA